jgi:hypothetical protein
MQATVVLLVALSGLGCHNKTCEVIDVQPTSSSYGGGNSSLYSSHDTPLPCPANDGGPNSGYDPSQQAGFGGVLLDTLYSFVYGRSPGVPSVREIEASVYGYRAGH